VSTSAISIQPPVRLAGLRLLRTSAFHVGLTVAAVLWSAPLIVLVFTAVKSAGDFAQNGTFAWPQAIDWGNFAEAWRLGVETYFLNSTVMTLLKVPTGILIEALAAFALTQMSFRAEKWIFPLFLIGLIVPVQMTLVPLTVLYRQLGLIDSLPGLFFLYLGFGLPFGVLVLRGFFRTVPRELIEAALLDGCSWLGVFWRVVLPLSKPALVSLLILDGIATWNEFVLAQIFLRSESNRTLPLGVVHFSTEFSTAYDLLAAAQCITILPLLLTYLFFQRYFVHGLAGALK
jgi:raffinose/stachyose/melibiose transport system permease protein